MMDLIRKGLAGFSVVLVLSGFALVAPREARAQGQPAAQAQAVLAESLIQFESNTLWESMRPSWRDRRAAWIAQVRGATSVPQIAALMVEFETIMTWEAMAPRWHQERPGWIAASRAAATPHDVAHAMLALEAATTWHAVNQTLWTAVREPWVARLRAL